MAGDLERAPGWRRAVATRVAELRRSGWDWTEIAGDLERAGHGKFRAKQLAGFMEALFRSEPELGVETQRELDARKCDAIYRRLQEKFESSPNAALATAMLKVLERRAILLGLNREKQGATASVVMGEFFRMNLENGLGASDDEFASRQELTIRRMGRALEHDAGGDAADPVAAG